MYSRIADKLPKGSNSSTFTIVSVDIGVIGMQGKATETRTTAKLTAKQKKKKKKKKKNIK